MTANDSNSYLSYLNKLVDEYDNTSHRSIGKKPIGADYSAKPEILNRVIKFLILKLAIESGLLTTRIYLA